MAAEVSRLGALLFPRRAAFRGARKHGEDPTEPWRSDSYPWPAVSHEPRIAEITEALWARGLHPSHTPLGIQLDESRREWSRCLRCETCDGYPCLVQGEVGGPGLRGSAGHGEGRGDLADGDQGGAVAHRRHRGREITGVEVVLKSGERAVFQADLYVASCGSINTAALLLRSANDQHTAGLANAWGWLVVTDEARAGEPDRREFLSARTRRDSRSR